MGATYETPPCTIYDTPPVGATYESRAVGAANETQPALDLDHQCVAMLAWVDRRNASLVQMHDSSFNDSSLLLGGHNNMLEEFYHFHLLHTFILWGL